MCVLLLLLLSLWWTRGTMGVGVGFPLWGGGYALFSQFVKDI